MATRLVKTTTAKSNKRHHHHHHHRHHHRRNRRNVPRCSSSLAAASILATINKSIHTCHRRLLRFVSALTCHHHRTAKGFKVLKNLHDLEPKNLIFTRFDKKHDSFTEKKRETIVLDLDETLVHSSMHHPPARYDFVVKPRIDGEILTFFVTKRPGLDEFLEKIREKFEVVVFTAGLREYASLVLDRLDPGRRVISHALYRDACRDVEGKLVKDLGLVARDLGRVLIVDDNPNSYALHPDNAIPIKPFVDDMKDDELKKLGEFIHGCGDVDDIRVVVKEFVARENF